MRRMVCAIACSFFAAGSLDMAWSQDTGYECAPLGLDAIALKEIKQTRLEDPRVGDLDAFAMSLIDCLRDTRPEIRDGVGYELLTFILRSQDSKLSSIPDIENLPELKTELLKLLKDEDAAGVAAPFAALVLSEIARTDRLREWMSDTERSEFVRAAVAYMQSIEDYRGFDDVEGWRHGVAHGADWLMQLSLNDALSGDDRDFILKAVASQIRADGEHAYIHGEPERLARPVLFLARAGHMNEMAWSAWLQTVADPAPFEKWDNVFSSEAGLAQRHNVKAFLYVLYVNAAHSENENVRRLLPGLTEQIKSIP